ncbi:DUF2863 family protein [Noviherbaspirillum galbum]|uniref:DUF2863 family protein n=1 Tax=Noviherbaspirillum galbum TaxID=2709383 RepID=A0A6B3SFB0_9BURK|nr:DUF2863 family protein [Noviherbaspirillum galbum]NEX59501.1 DUF2863 family protein [Noviherbaspirillum galbum]
MNKPKKKSPPSKRASRSQGPSSSQDETASPMLASLALDLTELDLYADVPDDLKKKAADLGRRIRKCLQQGRNGILGEALQLAREEDDAAWVALKRHIEDAAQEAIFRTEDGADVEVNAFVIPFFARTVGGLRADECFQDEAAFTHLRDSIQDAQLESAKARVVLVSHAYHLEELERLGYAQVYQMVREAHESMTRKKAVAAPVMTESMSGWPESGFAAEDQAVELRYLLGFTLKRLDDPFYAVPEKEAEADRYFAKRAERFRRWTRDAAPLLERCLVAGDRKVELDFLYQDLFYGGKAAGAAEHDVLQMLAFLQQAIDASGNAADSVDAIAGPADIGDDLVFRINLYAAASRELLASFDKPIRTTQTQEDEAEDVLDALSSLGLASLSLAARFEDDGEPVDPRPVSPG